MVSNKVYFSKSNAVPKETAEKIRRYILKFDVILKEFTGGAYSNSAMDSCEFLIVLPPFFNRAGESNIASVGRGIFQQTQYFYNKENKLNNILIITGYGLCDNKDVAYVEFSTPDYWNVRNHMDYVNYGDIHLKKNKSNMLHHFSFKKSKDVGNDVFNDILDSSGSIIACDISEPKEPIVYTEFNAWDEVYEEWFQEPIKKTKKYVIEDLVINPEDPEDYSLLLTM